ncbi:MAG: sulfate/molybdate ABC transporter ATP-binding protein [Hyphomonadaceae bacterium]
MSLVITDIKKQFGRFPALGGVSLFAQEGEFLALLGPSGSGKTTLLRVVAGLETPESGAIGFRGEDMLATPVRKRGIGFVFQHYALFRHMTVRDNVAFGMRAKPRGERLASKQIRARAQDLLDMVQLGELAERYPSQLSGGQRQRVALARALAIEPKILLLDEPFGALDAKVRRELRAWLRDLHERTGLTTIFVTHDQEEALELADRVAVLKDGLLEQIGAPEELYHDPASPFVFDFLGDAISFDCIVSDGHAMIDGLAAPIIGRAANPGPAKAYARPDEFEVALGEGPGFDARVRNLLLAGPDARISCALERGGAIEVRLPHEIARKLSPRDHVRLKPRHVRVWP